MAFIHSLVVTDASDASELLGREISEANGYAVEVGLMVDAPGLPGRAPARRRLRRAPRGAARRGRAQSRGGGGLPILHLPEHQVEAVQTRGSSPQKRS